MGDTIENTKLIEKALRRLRREDPKKFEEIKKRQFSRTMDLSKIKTLLVAGAQPSLSDLKYHVCGNNVDMVKLFVKNDKRLMWTPLDSRGSLPIHIASTLGYMRMLKELHKLGSNVDSRATITKETPLHGAVKMNQMETVQYLLDNNADTKAKDVKGRTPLHVAETPEMIRLLLKSGYHQDVVSGSSSE